jgi:hypothetical protein
MRLNNKYRNMSNTNFCLYILFCFVLLVLFQFLVFQASEVYSKKILLVILGGGVTSLGECPTHTKLRLERAVKLYHNLKRKGQDVTFVTMSGGTPYKPNPSDANGFPITESSAAARELINKMGITPEDVIEEAFSLDTLGNVSDLQF